MKRDIRLSATSIALTAMGTGLAEGWVRGLYILILIVWCFVFYRLTDDITGN